MKNVKEAMVLYAITDREWTGELTLQEQVRQALENGATCLQLREKNSTYEEFLQMAKDIYKICYEFRVPFIVNDNVDIAIEAKAGGVHVGQKDGNASMVRERIGKEMILGVSASTVEEAIQGEKDGADYLGVGAVFNTSTKDDAKVIDREELRAICSAVSIPVVAIGGINKDNVLELKGTGVDGIAVVSAIFASKNIPWSTKLMKNLSLKMIEEG